MRLLPFLVLALLLPAVAAASSAQSPLLTAATAQDNTEILELLRKAAEQGGRYVYPRLGDCYESGQCGVEKNPVQAYMWYSLHPDSFEKLDELTPKMSSEQIEEGKRLAAEWRLKAGSEKLREKFGGGVLCMWTLFTELKTVVEKCPSGPAVKRDLEEAYFWLILASSDTEMKDAAAMRHSVGARLTQEQRFAVKKRTESWKAAQQDDGKSEFEKGAQYQGTDDEQAANWYRQAAEKGNTVAQYSLGKLYAEGGGDVDDKEFVRVLDGAISRINEYIVANSSQPITKAELEEKVKTHRLLGGCQGSESAKTMIKAFKYLPPEDLNKGLDDVLSRPGPPSMNPCF